MALQLVVSTYYFVKITKGNVDLKTSFPLSRFLEGQSSTDLNFAVGGADAVTEVFDLLRIPTYL